MTSISIYNGVRYVEIDGVYRIVGCSSAPAFYSFGALKTWIDNNNWCPPRDADG